MQGLEEARFAKDEELDNQLEPDDPDVLDEEIDELNDGVDEQSNAWQKRPQQSSSSEPNDPSEREDLARFREEWKAEVMRQRQGGGVQILVASTSSAVDPSRSASKASEPSTRLSQPSTTATATAPIAPHSVETSAGSSATTATSKDPASLPLPPKLSKALEVYQRAVLHEQRSELEEALRLYRQAFRLDDNVARVYERLEYHSRLRAEGQHKPVRPPRESSGRVLGHAPHKSEDVVVEVAQSLDKLALGKPTAGYGVATGTLAHLVAGWPSDLAFDPEEEAEPVHIRVLPDELLVHILQFLDITALERFAVVNRKTRILTLDSTIWRERVEAIYIQPQIADDEDISTLLSQHMHDYRRLYIEHPRVRLDGVYIAVCHYIRDGLSESAWVNVSHLITYHRYLRFFPNGQVLSLLTNEEVPPQTVIPILYPTLRMKGFFIGQWRLDGTTVLVTNLMDPSGATMRYTFQMILELRSRPLGRWNRLDFVTYDSVSMESGEATPLALKNDRPFWFSKVRSYA